MIKRNTEDIDNITYITNKYFTPEKRKVQFVCQSTFKVGVIQISVRIKPIALYSTTYNEAGRQWIWTIDWMIGFFMTPRWYFHWRSRMNIYLNVTKSISVWYLKTSMNTSQDQFWEFVYWTFKRYPMITPKSKFWYLRLFDCILYFFFILCSFFIWYFFFILCFFFILYFFIL